jgi:hypothetical protein
MDRAWPGPTAAGRSRNRGCAPARAVIMPHSIAAGHGPNARLAPHRVDQAGQGPWPGSVPCSAGVRWRAGRGPPYRRTGGGGSGPPRWRGSPNGPRRRRRGQRSPAARRDRAAGRPAGRCGAGADPPSRGSPRCQLPLVAAQAQRRAAAALAQLGERAKAVERLRAAQQTTLRLSAGYLGDRINAAVAGLGERPGRPRGRSAAPAGLSSRGSR